MSKKLQITLSEEATKKYLEWASVTNKAHWDEDIEPCGCTLIIEIGGPYGSSAYGNTSNGPLEFGDADVDLI